MASSAAHLHRHPFPLRAGVLENWLAMLICPRTCSGPPGSTRALSRSRARALRPEPSVGCFGPSVTIPGASRKLDKYRTQRRDFVLDITPTLLSIAEALSPCKVVDFLRRPVPPGQINTAFVKAADRCPIVE